MADNYNKNNHTWEIWKMPWGRIGQTPSGPPSLRQIARWAQLSRLSAARPFYAGAMPMVKPLAEELSVMPQPPQPLQPPYSLTPREIEILSWAARGKSAWQIGTILHIAKRTVDAHANSAVRKIGAMNRTHAVVIALRDQIIDIDDETPE